MKRKNWRFITESKMRLLYSIYLQSSSFWYMKPGLAITELYNFSTQVCVENFEVLKLSFKIDFRSSLPAHVMN